MPRQPKVAKAAVLERSRRSTAGKRMSTLVGQAQDDDDTFWSHSIWSEGGGGFAGKGSRKRMRDDDDDDSSSSSSDSDDESTSDGEGSYRMSEDDSAAGVDQFDSDFDESETDDDDEDGEGDEEKELRAEERREKASKRKKNQRLGMPSLKSTRGRELVKGKKTPGKMTKRGPLGEGWNQGLVLNWPPPAIGGQSIANGVGTKQLGVDIQLFTDTINNTSSISQTIPQQHTSQSVPLPISTGTTTQIATKPPPPITASQTSPLPKPKAKRGPKPKRQTATQLKQEATAERKKINRHNITQEEMILESIKSTEIDNVKWLSSRKRSKEEAAQLEKATVARKSSLNNQKPVSRFHSRRGCNNTITFMDMDQLPEILTRRQAVARPVTSTRSIGSSSPKRRRMNSTTSETETTTTKPEKKCFITGKVAKYRDPKTKHYYHDKDAFKELRRRLDAGEIKIPKPAVVAHKSNGKRKSNEESNNTQSAKKRGRPRKDATTDHPSTMYAQLKSKAKSQVAQGAPKWYAALDNETLRMIAKKFQLNLTKLVDTNKKMYKTIRAHSKLMEGTRIQISHLDQVDLVVKKPKNLKVRVTQKGIPVSPPNSIRDKREAAMAQASQEDQTSSTDKKLPSDSSKTEKSAESVDAYKKEYPTKRHYQGAETTNAYKKEYPNKRPSPRNSEIVGVTRTRSGSSLQNMHYTSTDTNGSAKEDALPTEVATKAAQPPIQSQPAVGNKLENGTKDSAKPLVSKADALDTSGNMESNDKQPVKQPSIEV